jgi:glycosyltransferase involved in cell wall biosynthesis
MLTTVVSSRGVASRAAATARTDPGGAVVLDLDGTYSPVAGERVLRPRDVGLDPREVAVRRVLLDARGMERWARPRLVRHLLETETVVLSVRPGVLLRPGAGDAWEAAARDGVALAPRAPVPDDTRWPAAVDVFADGSFEAAIIAVGSVASAFVAEWEQMPDDRSDRWLDVLASRHPHRVMGGGAVMSAWSSSGDVAGATAVDLSTLDTASPWLLDRRATSTPRVRLSDLPQLAAMVSSFVDEVGNDPAPWAVSSVGVAVEPHLRAVVGAAVAAGASFVDIPDVFDPLAADELTAWLTAPTTASGGLGRYLAEVYAARPDLRSAFPNPTGSDRSALEAWAAETGLAGLAEGPAPTTVAKDTVRAEGVNVIGYLSGELGIGESARLMLSAIDAAHVPHATVAVTKHLKSRQSTAYRAASADVLFDVSLLCVNAKETPSVAASVAAVTKGSYRIGMWYWETEVFPPNQHKGFRHVDEVWVATDFVRDAIEPHSPVPVRTITPPLPQPGEHISRDAARARLGLPDRPLLLFAFDYASVAERKNPWGVVDAFEEAYADGADRPLLVIKSISGDRSPAEAERLRLRVAGSADVLLIEDYLDAGDRDALMAACDCYISLHRAEGLGLTMAEAMAAGKPVIATAYGGNLQFMTSDNSYLVPSSPVAVAPGSGPYTPGVLWADPDVTVAARMIRRVFDDLEAAAVTGRRAAADISTLHSPEAAGRAVSARLDEIRGGSSRPVAAGQRSGLARRATSAVRRRLER